MNSRTNSRMNTFTVYSIGVAITWAILLMVTWLFAPARKRRTVFLVFGGFTIGWTSAAIARYVYPPPKKYQQAAAKTR